MQPSVMKMIARCHVMNTGCIHPFISSDTLNFTVH